MTLPNLHVEDLTRNVTVFGDRDFRGSLSLTEVIRMGISSNLIRGGVNTRFCFLSLFFSLSLFEDTQRI